MLSNFESNVVQGQQLGYDCLTVRNLIRGSFNADEFETFCFDHFRPVYEDFTPAMSETLRIQHLINYCDRNNLCDKLVALIREANPNQYRRYESELIKPIVELPQIDPSRTVLVQLSLEFDLSDFTDTVQYTIISALALILRIPSKQIRRTDTRSGSVILTVEMPIDSAERLESLHSYNDPVLKDLQITKVRILTSYFDPYSLALLILSVLISTRSLTYYQHNQISDSERLIQKRVRHLARLLYKTASLVTMFRNFLKTKDVLQSEFRLGSIKISINEDDFMTIDRIHRSAFRINRLFLQILNDLMFYLKPSETEMLISTMSKVELLLERAVLIPDYHHLLLNFKDSVSYIFEFAYKLGKIYEKDETRFVKIFKSSNIFEQWQDYKSGFKLIRRIPIVSHIAAGLGHPIAEENIEGYVEVERNEGEDNDYYFAVVVEGDSMIHDDISPGDVVLIRQQPTVKNGEIAAIVIITPASTVGVLKRYYVVQEGRKDLAHWLLESSNPSSDHLVVIPGGADSVAIRSFYSKRIAMGKILIRFYDNAELAIAGKYVGSVRKN